MGWTAPRTWTDGEFVTATMMNAHVRDNLMNIGNHVYVPKASDTSRASNITAAADPTLTMAVGGNEVWTWRARVYIITGAGGWRWNWTAPTGASGKYYIQSALATTQSARDVDYNSEGTDSGTFTDTLHTHGVLLVGSTAGNLTLSWAQTSSNATNTTVKAGSYIMARRIS